MSRGHMMSTPASIGHCPRCRAAVFNGWAEGLLSRADLTPLTVEGERSIRSGGRETFALGAGELFALDDWRASEPAHRLLLPAHLCGQPVDIEHRAKLPGADMTQARS